MSNSANSLNIKSAGIPVFDGVATFTESTTTQFNVLVGGASNAIANVAPSATSGVALISQGNASNPTFGTVAIAGGGTNATSMANTDGVVYYDGTRLVTTAVGSATQVLTSNGPGLAPTFQAAGGGGGGITTLNGDSGSATGATVTIAGGSNISTSAAGSTVTINLVSSPSVSGSVTAGTGFTATTGDVTVTSGNIHLPNTTASVGKLFLGTTLFLSDWGSNNAFIAGAGNTTTNATGCLGIGNGALMSLTTVSGSDNVGLGSTAGQALTTGTQNTLVGASSGDSLTTGSENTIVGFSAATAATTAGNNIVIGRTAASNLSTGTNNVIIGAFTGGTTTGGNNIVIGPSAFGSPTGTENTIIGDSAGQNYSGAESNNILLGSFVQGTTGESNTIHIGDGVIQPATACFIAGIFGSTVDVGTGTAVFVDTNNLLGTVVSSRRFKENIKDMGATSESIYKLRPVTFNMISDKNKSSLTGLIAEEVAKVMPQLVLTKDGQPYSVKYEQLPALLLNELQKLQSRIQILEDALAALSHLDSSVGKSSASNNTVI